MNLQSELALLRYNIAKGVGYGCTDQFGSKYNVMP